MCFIAIISLLLEIVVSRRWLTISMFSFFLLFVHGFFWYVKCRRVCFCLVFGICGADMVVDVIPKMLLFDSVIWWKSSKNRHDFCVCMVVVVVVICGIIVSLCNWFDFPRGLDVFVFVMSLLEPYAFSKHTTEHYAHK